MSAMNFSTPCFRQRKALVVCIVLAMTMALSGAEVAPLTIAVTPSDVRVANATPGERVILFSAAIESYGGHLRQYTTIKEVPDDDKDGIITYTSEGPIALRSVWIAVEENSGRSVIGGRPGYPVTLLPFPTHLVKKDADGIIGLVDVEGRTAELLIVRPKHGAWLVKGNIADPRVHNGKLTLTADDARPISDSEPTPFRIRNGDVLVLINTGRLEVSVVEIGK